MPARGGDKKTGGESCEMVSGTAHDKTPMNDAVMGYGAFVDLMGKVRRAAGWIGGFGGDGVEGKED